MGNFARRFASIMLVSQITRFTDHKLLYTVLVVPVLRSHFAHDTVQYAELYISDIYFVICTDVPLALASSADK